MGAQLRILSLAVVGILLGHQAVAGEATVRRFHADLDANGETALVASPAKGHVEMKLELPSLRLHWNLTFTGLTSEPTELALHGPAQPGANGIPQFALAQKGAKSPVQGTAVLNDAQVEYMLSGWTYVDVQTLRNPKGEIRGQLRVEPPSESDR